MLDSVLILTSPLPAYLALTFDPQGLFFACVVPACGLTATIMSWLLVGRRKSAQPFQTAELLIVIAALTCGYGLAPRSLTAYQRTVSSFASSGRSKGTPLGGASFAMKNHAPRSGLLLNRNRYKGDLTPQFFLRFDQDSAAAATVPLYLREQSFQQFANNRWFGAITPSVRLDADDAVTDGWTDLAPLANRNISDFSKALSYTVFDTSSGRPFICSIPQVCCVAGTAGRASWPSAGKSVNSPGPSNGSSSSCTAAVSCTRSS